MRSTCFEDCKKQPEPVEQEMFDKINWMVSIQQDTNMETWRGLKHALLCTVHTWGQLDRWKNSCFHHNLVPKRIKHTSAQVVNWHPAPSPPSNFPPPSSSIHQKSKKDWEPVRHREFWSRFQTARWLPNTADLRWCQGGKHGKISRPWGRDIFFCFPMTVFPELHRFNFYHYILCMPSPSSSLCIWKQATSCGKKSGTYRPLVPKISGTGRWGYTHIFTASW